MSGQLEVTRRQAEIADLVQTVGFVSVESLAKRFAVTTQTIRRDVNRLCVSGVLRRIHGGVEPPAPTGNVDYRMRRILNLPAKRRIAQKVAAQVTDGTSLAFSIGTTLEIVMQRLTGHGNLRIFTNNLNVAFAAAENPSFEVTIAGGRLRTGDRDVVTPDTPGFFARYKVDIGVFGVGGVDADGSLLDFHEAEVAARQAILENCRSAFLVLDGSKFGRSAHVRGGHIGEVSHVFCDRSPPPEIADMLAEAGGQLVICDDADVGP